MQSCLRSRRPPVVQSVQPRQRAGRQGRLSAEHALKCITINAARILGLEKQLGSIEPGKDADIVILDRHPLDISSRVAQVFINGEKALP